MNVSNRRNKKQNFVRRCSFRIEEDYLTIPCQLCGAKHTQGNRLVVHHRYPISSFPEFIDKEWNLVTVCEECHKKLHKVRTLRIDQPEDLAKLIIEGKIR